jgi:CRISPR system Cascade subunit CasC
MLIQIHILQNYGPANLNRDDSGSPKDAIFGGYRRGRISSQCLKRSIRRSEAFRDAFEAEKLLGVRTKRLPKLIGDELKAMGVDAETIKGIMARVPEIGRESVKEKAQSEDKEELEGSGAEAEPAEAATKQLIFLGRDELRPLAGKLMAAYRRHGVKKWATAKMAEITRDLGSSVPRSVDIALFGRMTTSEAFEDVQAAVQVAHALSTNSLTQEFDYYTAVDDLSGESGAGMIGDVEFNSSTYYKYLNVHWEGLVENLGGDRQVGCRAVLALVEAAATAQPSGKQNSFAAHSLPDLILVEVRERNLPVSYANAFLKPARAAGERSLVDDSVAKLADYMSRVARTFGLSGTCAFTAVQDYAFPQGQSLPSLSDLKEWLAAQLPG